MQLTNLQSITAAAITSVFETGSVSGADRYSLVSITPGDPGGLSYGKHQVTLNSGNLYFLLDRFYFAATISGDNADYAAIEPYLDKVLAKDSRLNNDSVFIALLKRLGTTPVMQQTQDTYFNDLFWKPCLSVCTVLNFERALSAAVVYDSFVQGAWKTVSALTVKEFGDPGMLGETRWITKYVIVRRSWLANNSISILHNTVYRQDAFIALLTSGNWDLELPFGIHGLFITEAMVDGASPQVVPSNTIVHASADNNKPILFVGCPYEADRECVLQVQTALNAFGYRVVKDGIYGLDTAAAVAKFQSSHGLSADGKVGTITYRAMNL